MITRSIYFKKVQELIRDEQGYVQEKIKNSTYEDYVFQEPYFTWERSHFCANLCCRHVAGADETFLKMAYKEKLFSRLR